MNSDRSRKYFVYKNKMTAEIILIIILTLLVGFYLTATFITAKRLEVPV